MWVSIFLGKQNAKLGVVVHTCLPRAWDLPFAHLTFRSQLEGLPSGTCSDTKININYPVMLLCISYMLSRSYLGYIQWDKYFIIRDFRAGKMA